MFSVKHFFPDTVLIVSKQIPIISINFSKHKEDVPITGKRCRSPDEDVNTHQLSVASVLF